MKVAIVTGAAQGIGRRTAEVLAGAGYAVAALDVQSCAGTLAAISALGWWMDDRWKLAWASDAEAVVGVWFGVWG